MDARFEAQQKPAKITNASVIITPNEVTYRHGTGALIKRVFSNDAQIISVRSDNHYGGEHSFGLESYYLPQRGWSRKQVFTNIAHIFADHEVSRIFCVPYYSEDVLTAIAIKELFGVPMGIWIMDDQNIRANNIPDALMEEFLQKADVRFATHPELRDAYENKFGLKFWILPAVVPQDLIKTEIFQPLEENCQQQRGALLGSIWSQRWFADLCHSVKEAGVQLDWYGNSKYYWLTESEQELQGKGIYPQGLFPEDKLVEKLKEYPFVVVPTGTMDERDDQPQLSQLSLPGRILFALATSNTPVILMGSEKTSAASFIKRFQIGVVCDYTPESFGTAVAEVLDPQRQRVIRENAVAAAEKFSDRNIDTWIWDSLAEGQAVDARFEAQTAKIIDASVVITASEVNYRHGTGALVRRVFPNDGQIISVRSDNHYGGDHNFGLESYHLPQRGWSRKEVFSNITHIFADHEVSRIFCVPYYTEDLLTAIAIKELFGVPLGIWIMDDQNIRVNNIPDALMEEFLQKADVRFATHPELRGAYENKFGLKFWILPAVVPHKLIKTTVFEPRRENCQQKRGALLGSIWSQQWFADLCHTIEEAGVQLDWYGNSKYYWLTESEQELQAKGIYAQGLFPEDKLVEKLKEYPFVVVPTGTMDERDDQPQFSQLSLPGRILFALATSNTPVILMGSKKTSAASFVNRFQIGVVCDYTPESFLAAVVEVLDPQRQRVLRENAVAAAEKFGDHNIDSWIWSSLAEGQAADDRFESLFLRSPIDLVNFIEPPVPSFIYKDYTQVYQVMRRLKVNHYRPDFVMDVGASHGIWSHTASQLFPEAQFILIDPLINRYEQAARNYYLKNIPKAKFLEIAVSNESGQLSFQVSSDLYGSSLLNPADFRDYETETVAVKTLDQVAEEENIQGRGILKLDVQFAEHIVLAGAKNFLDQVDLVIAELSYARYEENALVFLEMLNLLDQLGFRYYDETGEWRSPIDGTLLQKEVVFIRQDLLVPQTSRKI
ncbi:beta-1,6-galactofuranosyltransferase [Synechocystis sp. CACIAM 05]|nr:beta-1,6-galactofuranosyltransferase [Synechocystis sp. CACIAM 05]